MDWPRRSTVETYKIITITRNTCLILYCFMPGLMSFKCCFQMLVFISDGSPTWPGMMIDTCCPCVCRSTMCPSAFLHTVSCWRRRCTRGQRLRDNTSPGTIDGWWNLADCILLNIYIYKKKTFYKMLINHFWPHQIWWFLYAEAVLNTPGAPKWTKFWANFFYRH